MYCLRSALFILLSISFVNCGVLLWSTKSFRLPALKVLTEDDLNALITYLDNPKVVILKGDPKKYSNELEKQMVDKYTAYIPTESEPLASLEENVELIDLNANTVTNLNEENVLYIIINGENERFKRDDENEDETDENSENGETPTGPVWYNAEGKAMIYSSKPPVLKMNATNIILGRSVFANIDSRGTYTRLNVGVPYEGRKITLRFKFLWSLRGYWTLESVEIEGNDDEAGRYRYMLLAVKLMIAPRNFSYHCTGEILFSDAKNDVDLVLFDMQAQPDALNSIFGSAYDCISFTTVPIWSGILVTFILLIGLAFGLGAMDSIKTMDRFDNSKTKALTITVGE